MNKIPYRFFSLLIILVLALSNFSNLSVDAATNTYYVSPTGDDNNTGTLNKPWKTIQKAANTLVAGDKVYIRAGVYVEVVNISTSGTQAQPIQFLAYAGETPVIDGNNYQLPTDPNGAALLFLSGDYLQVSGLEVRYSQGAGVILSGQSDLASNLNVHDNQGSGVQVFGGNDIVENSQIWQNTSVGLTAGRLSSQATLRGNVVYDNSSNGVLAYQSNGADIENNTVYDNKGANAFISDSTNIQLQRNLIYISASSPFTNGIGILLGDDSASYPSSNITVINNLLYGNYRNFYWYKGAGSGMNNVLVAYNSFVDSSSYYGIQINAGSHQGVRFMDNIVQQDGSLPVAYVGSSTGIQFSHNLWSKIPPAAAAGAGDIVGDPRLARTGDITSPEWYRPQATSPVINKALVLSEVTDDYFNNPRGSTPDIGAIELIYYQIFLPMVIR